MPSRAVRNSLLPVSFYQRRRTIAATAAATAFALALTTLNASAARAASPDWNLGNTEASQISNLNAQADGVVRNPGLGKCLDDLSGKTANGSTVDSSACNGSANQNWTFNPGSDYYWDLGFHGSVTLDSAPGKCLDIGSANGGAAASIAVGGAVQMMLTTSGEVYAKSGVGLGGWTKESDFEVQRIAAGSDGTQMMVGADGVIYARNTIGASGWTNEGSYEAKAISANDGVQLYLGDDGTVYARNGIGAAAGWTAESAAGATAISVRLRRHPDDDRRGRGRLRAFEHRRGLRHQRPGGWTRKLVPGAKAIATNGGVQIARRRRRLRVRQDRDRAGRLDQGDRHPGRRPELYHRHRGRLRRHPDGDRERQLRVRQKGRRRTTAGPRRAARPPPAASAR